RRRTLIRASRAVRAALAAIAPALGLGTRSRRSYPSPDPGLTTQAAEQTDSRLFQDLDLGIVLVDAELIERGLLGFVDGLARRLDPFHRLLPLLLLASSGRPCLWWRRPASAGGSGRGWLVGAVTLGFGALRLAALRGAVGPGPLLAELRGGIAEQGPPTLRLGTGLSSFLGLSGLGFQQLLGLGRV